MGLFLWILKIGLVFLEQGNVGILMLFRIAPFAAYVVFQRSCL